MVVKEHYAICKKYFFPENELITPPLTDGLILPGVLRDTVLTIAREWNEFRVTERYPTMEELKQALAEGRVSLRICDLNKLHERCSGDANVRIWHRLCCLPHRPDRVQRRGTGSA
jgi:hypothetical protein